MKFIFRILMRKFNFKNYYKLINQEAHKSNNHLKFN